MLNIQQISDAISDIRHHGSIEDFERWFRRESRNVHSWGSGNLVQVVLAVEAVLSEYRFAGMQDVAAQQELANAVLPFAVTLSYQMAKPAQEFTLSDMPVRVGPKPEFGTVFLGEDRYQVAYV